MRLAVYLGILLALALHPSDVNAQQVDTSAFPRVSIPETEVRYLRSSIVGDEFEISVALPTNYRSTNTTYPVLYAPDANVGFAMSTQIERIMQIGNELPQVIGVGIGYRTDSLGKWLELRSRDLTPTSIPDPTKNGWRTGGAAQFLRFMREELMPFIKKNYRTSPDAAYYGDSYGGLFGLYVLFHQPDTFGRYIIASPSIWYDNLVTLQYEADYATRHTDLSARVFMSVGELEEQAGDAERMVTNMKQLANKLLSRRYPSFRLQTVVFDGETHVSVCAAAFSRGLQVIYQK